MRIFIEDLTFEAILGVLPRERRTPQPIRIDITIEYDYRDGDFIDYAQVAELVRDTIRSEKFELIEEALTQLFVRLPRTFTSIKTLRIKIAKPAILPDAVVAVEDFRNFRHPPGIR